eukprot:1161848-Pelagomonas_calceolata.AAC.4
MLILWLPVNGAAAQVASAESAEAGIRWLASWIAEKYAGMGKTEADALPGGSLWWGLTVHASCTWRPMGSDGAELMQA